MCIYVKAHTQLFATLNIKLGNTFSTKNAEHALFRELIMCFNHIVLRLPSITRTSRNTPLLWENGNDFSFYFHD